MAAFQASATAQQSVDGFLATFLDLSNYTDNTEGYQTSDFDRSFVLTDAYGMVLATLPLVGSALSATYTLTADEWIAAELVLTSVGLAPNYSAYIDLPFDRITKNIFRQLLKKGCCQNKAVDQRLTNALNYIIGSNFEALGGDGAGFNVDIQAANSYLTAPIY